MKQSSRFVLLLVCALMCALVLSLLLNPIFSSRSSSESPSSTPEVEHPSFPAGEEWIGREIQFDPAEAARIYDINPRSSYLIKEVQVATEDGDLGEWCDIGREAGTAKVLARDPDPGRGDSFVALYTPVPGPAPESQVGGEVEAVGSQSTDCPRGSISLNEGALRQLLFFDPQHAKQQVAANRAEEEARVARRAAAEAWRVAEEARIRAERRAILESAQQTSQ